MKTILFITAIISLSFSTQILNTNETKNISGFVLDAENNPVHSADVFINDSKKGSMTDSTGSFNMIVPGDVEFLTVSKYGYKVKVFQLEGKTEVKIILEKGSKVERISTMSRKEASELRLRGLPAMRKKDAPMSERSMKPSKSFAVESMPVSDGSYSEGAVDDYEAPTSSSMEEYKARESDQDTRAGQLTAGEWNDLSNWEAWNDLVQNKDYKEMEEYWQIDASERVSVFVTNEYELPIPDCLVTMKSNGKIIWTAKTDNSGKAELWMEKEVDDVEVLVESKNNRQTISNVKRSKAGVNNVQFKEECSAPRMAEIMFVVDATGSMGDEIEFLKSELSDVIDQVESVRSEVNFRWGSVFYRDNTDEYLTRQSSLNSKTKKVLDFINMQSAGGGGDYPEAVNEGLEEALMQEWSNDAIARIVFLVLDAPPHHDQEVMKDLESQIAFASAMGIKIIPITASGINRQTEYLMKFMSIMTNGTYVFLTDHSGIGNAHLDPVVTDFEVEKLNDLLIRIIGNYTDPGTCVQQEDNDPVFASIQVYPNPTVDLVQLTVPEGVEKITLTTSSGMLIKTEKGLLSESEITLDLSTYVDGMYVVNFYSKEKVYSVKLIKSNKA
jgi:hypothetical protein